MLQGVHVSREIEYELSKGFLYIFRSKINSSIILADYDSFYNTILWKWHFKGKDSESYEPRYDLDIDTPMPAPRASIPIEAGLAEGRSRLLGMIEESPKAESTVHLRIQSARKLLKYLADNDLFITTTDKNIGIVIVYQTWHLRMCKDCLKNDSSITKIYIDRIHEVKKHLQRHIDQVVMSRTYSLTEQEENILLAYTWNDDLRKLPRFSGLHKIHKKPTKFRPIIACHSFTGETAASMLCHLLEDKVKSSPTVLLNSRTLNEIITKLKVTFGKTAFMLSVEVEAFYPNVPLNAIHDIVEEAVTKYHRQIKGHLARELYSIVNNYLVFIYSSELYLPTDGLAMGVASSPHIANLYAARYEQHMIKDLNVLLYNRYIDHILTIIIASTKEDVLTYAKETLLFAGLNLNWEVGKYPMVFLDLEILHVLSNSQYDIRPYRKPLNHIELIPFLLDIQSG